MKSYHQKKFNFCQNIYQKILFNIRREKMKKIIVMFLLIYTIISTTCFAAAPKLITNLEKNLDTIKSWIIRIATPAAAVAIGAGVMMKKFSFGDEERVVQGKKLIRSTLFSYAFILSVDLVLKAIESLFG